MKMKLDELRTRFLDYFKRNGHTVVPSSSLIPENDPTLLFTNAGMNQFKDVFLGMEKRAYTRACSSQKCFRVSGKHNDLENVGYTARHHTFFEMLGNFSFGDYFKKEAIAFAWEFISKELLLDKNKLWITVYEKDDEAFELWQKVAGVSKKRIVRMGEKDNFWSMGETGPCGPCSEIVYDQGEGVGCGKPDCKVGCECDRYLELWNLVFMQYNREESGRMAPLPNPSIDTGMGLERITAVLQSVPSNYDTDHFQAIISKIKELSEKSFSKEDKLNTSMRVIADHTRAITFLIADGVLPSNEGRGYVLRRVMRRAERHAKLMGFEKPILYLVSERVIDLMRNAYPELNERRALILEVIRNEEERFLQTLDYGLGLIREAIEKHRKEKSGWVLPGEIAFRLYDTYGFPLDLTQAIGRDEGFEVDLEGFEREMERQRERARASWKGSGAETVDALYKQLRAQGIKTEFSGYERLKDQAKIIALIEQGALKEEVSKPGAEFQLVSERTPFYGETGGQVGDQGMICGKGFEARVIDTQRPLEGLIIHHCQLVNGRVKSRAEVELIVDEERRKDIARNHSATHLLQASLRRLLGAHIQQKGSLVAPERFRFDFTHFSPLSEQELKQVERLVNEMIIANKEIRVDYLSYSEALKRGAMALFGEKYGEVVRLVEMDDFSRELCGGTHCQRTGDIGFFKILSEGSVSAGVRRIEAITGRSAVEFVQAQEELSKKLAKLLKCSLAELPDRVQRLLEENKKRERELKQAREGKSGLSLEEILKRAKEINQVRVLTQELEFSDFDSLLEFSDRVFAKLGKGVLVFGMRDNEKAYLLVRVSKELTKKISAVKIISAISEIIGGRGGGKPELARGGGNQPEKLKEALETGERLILEQLTEKS